MASNYWIKLYHEMLDDCKIGRLSDSQFRLMINLFLLAGDCEQDGYLPTIEDIRWRLRNPENFDADMATLMDLQILTTDEGVLVVNKFSERQSAMDPTERTRRRREKLQKAEYYGNENETNRFTGRNGNGLDIDKDKDIDKDEDLIKQPGNFFTLFQKKLNIPLTGSKDLDYVKDLLKEHGEKKLLEVIEWYAGLEDRNYATWPVLRAIDTAAQKWTGKPKRKSDNRKEIFKMLGQQEA